MMGQRTDRGTDRGTDRREQSIPEGPSAPEGEARSVDPLARQLASTSRRLYERGWMDARAGNLSVRVPEPAGRVLITASGVSKAALTAADLVEVDLGTGAALDPRAPRPSAETAIHTALLRVFGDCDAVVHAHPPHATVTAAHALPAGSDAGLGVVGFRDFELIKGFGLADPSRTEVPVFRNWADVARIGRDVERYYAGAGRDAPPVLLIAHHGATAWGPTLDVARDRIECLEALCQLRLLYDMTRSVGDPR